MPPPNVLILGGTAEARRLAHLIADAQINAVISLAGRVAQPLPQATAQRIGGFGGVHGLSAYLNAHAITHVIDATHPFAARISANADAACAAAQVPLIALSRPPWKAQTGDDWRSVPDIESAALALQNIAEPQRVMLAIGRMHLPAFACAPHHDYLLRLIDPPQKPLPLPRAKIIIARGPFTDAGDLALLRRHEIQLIVAKNAGGIAAQAKLSAARTLGLPVIMIARPAAAQRREATSPQQVLDWLNEASSPR